MPRRLRQGQIRSTCGLHNRGVLASGISAVLLSAQYETTETLVSWGLKTIESKASL